jgi:D-cysteine desulfhydrase
MAALPTPLQAAPRLSEELGAEVWLKRDDLTGLGLGGNKVRGLEYLLGAALEQGCDTLVTGAGPQSNWAMLAAVAALRNGMEPHLVFYGSATLASGNLHLDELVGAKIHYTGDDDRASVDEAIEAVADKLQAAGRRPCRLPRGGATALGSVGYVHAALELGTQLLDRAVAPRQLWLATGSCGTQAGLVAGSRWLRPTYDVVGVSVSRPVEECVRRVTSLADGAAGLLGLPQVGSTDDVSVLGGHLGPGYGQASEEGDAATALVARSEGIFLDPVFGAKAMAALIGSARRGTVKGPVLFLVSGGAPTLFSQSKGAM